MKSGAAVTTVMWIFAMGFATLAQDDATDENICSLKPENGPCRAAKPYFYFDPAEGKCKSFTYGGCRGNDNRFSTEEECLNRCNTIDRLQCNFDDMIRCGLKNDPMSDINMTVTNKPTPSWNNGQTGPAADNTAGSSQGNYAFLEASSPALLNDIAGYITGGFREGQYCLQFAYHMKGAGIGSLNVFKTSDMAFPFFTIEGEEGSDWKLAVLSVYLNQNEKLRFIVSRGKTWTGDIALDDISIEQGVCPTEPIDTTPQESIMQLKCNFDDDVMPLCGFSQGSYLIDNFDWTRHSGKTETQRTGPQGDHTSGQGYYLYIESSVQQEDDSAILVSPPFQTGLYCVQLWYHMYSQSPNSIGSLSISTSAGDEAVWSKSKVTAYNWTPVSVDVNLESHQRILINATRGIGVENDIAIDDISISLGSCASAASQDPRQGMSPPLLEGGQGKQEQGHRSSYAPGELNPQPPRTGGQQTPGSQGTPPKDGGGPSPSDGKEGPLPGRNPPDQVPPPPPPSHWCAVCMVRTPPPEMDYSSTKHPMVKVWCPPCPGDETNTDALRDLDIDPMSGDTGAQRPVEGAGAFRFCRPCNHSQRSPPLPPVSPGSGSEELPPPPPPLAFCPPCLSPPMDEVPREEQAIEKNPWCPFCVAPKPPPGCDRYPPSPRGEDRYPRPPREDDRDLPPHDGDRYPPPKEGDRDLPPHNDGDRYPPPPREDDRYPPPPPREDDRYPPPRKDGRYPPPRGEDRYPPPRKDGRYPPPPPPEAERSYLPRGGERYPPPPRDAVPGKQRPPFPSPPFDEPILEMRLVGGRDESEGRVEVNYKESWGTVCSDGFDWAAANVVCRSLGFVGAIEAVEDGTFSQGSESIWYDGIKCLPHDPELAYCRHNEIGVHDCDHAQDVGVRCTNYTDEIPEECTATETARKACRPPKMQSHHGMPPKPRPHDGGMEDRDEPMCYDENGQPRVRPDRKRPDRLPKPRCRGACRGKIVEDVRLAGSSEMEGRLEVQILGEWGTVCNTGFNWGAANTVCKMLGFYGATEVLADGAYPTQQGQVLLDGVRCTGSEPSLDECCINEPKVLSAGCDRHSKDVAISCTNNRDLVPGECSEMDDPKRCRPRPPREPAEPRGTIRSEGRDEPPPPPPPPFDNDIPEVRLIGGRNSSEGRLEVKYTGGDWGTVCSDGFSWVEATVACRSLGFRHAIEVVDLASIGVNQGTGYILLDGLKCKPHDPSLGHCCQNTVGTHDCSHSDDVAIKCTNDKAMMPAVCRADASMEEKKACMPPIEPSEYPDRVPPPPDRNMPPPPAGRRNDQPPRPDRAPPQGGTDGQAMQEEQEGRRNQQPPSGPPVPGQPQQSAQGGPHDGQDPYRQPPQRPLPGQPPRDEDQRPKGPRDPQPQDESQTRPGDGQSQDRPDVDGQPAGQDSSYPDRAEERDQERGGARSQPEQPRPSAGQTEPGQSRGPSDIDNNNPDLDCECVRDAGGDRRRPRPPRPPPPPRSGHSQREPPPPPPEEPCIIMCQLRIKDALFYTDFEADFGRLSHSRGVGGMQWKRKSGPTDTSGTGPDSDHTNPKNDKGHYAYLESSDGREDNTVVFATPNIDRNTAACLQFSYHMYGATTRSLEVVRIFDGTAKREVVFSKSGNLGNQWLQAEIDITADSHLTYFKIIATRGESYTGDIAIDDVIARRGPCGSQ